MMGDTRIEFAQGALQQSYLKVNELWDIFVNDLATLTKDFEKHAIKLNSIWQGETEESFAAKGKKDIMTIHENLRITFVPIFPYVDNAKRQVTALYNLEYGLGVNLGEEYSLSVNPLELPVRKGTQIPIEELRIYKQTFDELKTKFEGFVSKVETINNYLFVQNNWISGCNRELVSASLKKFLDNSSESVGVMINFSNILQNNIDNYELAFK